jgi:4-hydroxybenzoate polyprenyltransferase
VSIKRITIYAGLFLRIFLYPATFAILLVFAIDIITARMTGNLLKILYGAISLVCLYIVATSVNDLVDEKIDRVNGRSDKMLTSGNATRFDVYLLHAVSIVLAVCFAYMINIYAVYTVIFSVTISYLYSLPPFKFSYHPILSPILLAASYVWIPYMMATSISMSNPSRLQWLVSISIFLLFIGRILLKDFSDQKGDAQYGKKTFFLQHGIYITRMTAIGCFVLGTGMVIFVYSKNYLLITFLILFSCILVTLTHKILSKSNPTSGYIPLIFNALLVALFSVLFGQYEKINSIILSLVLSIFTIIVIIRVYKRR